MLMFRTTSALQTAGQNNNRHLSRNLLQVLLCGKTFSVCQQLRGFPQAPASRVKVGQIQSIALVIEALLLLLTAEVSFFQVYNLRPLLLMSSLDCETLFTSSVSESEMYVNNSKDENNYFKTIQTLSDHNVIDLLLLNVVRT